MKKIKLTSSRTSFLFSSLHSSFPSNAKKRVRQQSLVVWFWVMAHSLKTDTFAMVVCKGVILYKLPNWNLWALFKLIFVHTPTIETVLTRQYVTALYNRAITSVWLEEWGGLMNVSIGSTHQKFSWLRFWNKQLKNVIYFSANYNMANLWRNFVTSCAPILWRSLFRPKEIICLCFLLPTIGKIMELWCWLGYLAYLQILFDRCKNQVLSVEVAIQGVP